MAALEGPQEFVQQMRQEFERRRTCLAERLAALPGGPNRSAGRGFLYFPQFFRLLSEKNGGKTIKDSLELADYLLEQAQIAVVPGAAFGEDQCLRFSYATSPALIEKGMDRLEKALKG